MKYTFIMLFLLSSFYLQAQNISGTISDATTGKKIEGASVKLLNTGIGVVTDTNGNFTMNGKGSLEVSFLGYKKIRINNTGHFLSIEMTPEVNQLQTVEVVGRTAKDYNSEYSFSATRISTLIVTLMRLSSMTVMKQ